LKSTENHAPHLEYILQKLKIKALLCQWNEECVCIVGNQFFGTYVVLKGHETQFEENPNHQKMTKFNHHQRGEVLPWVG
jgi:hypothetical protein